MDNPVILDIGIDTYELPDGQIALTFAGLSKVNGINRIFERAKQLTAVEAKPSRNIREVLRQIVPLIPVDTPDPEEDYTELKQQIEDCAGDWYGAPEIEMPLWMGAAGVLNEWLETPSKDWPEWKWQVLTLFTGKLNIPAFAPLVEPEIK